MLSDDDRESVASDVSFLSSEISYSFRVGAGAGAVLEESGGAGDLFNDIMERLSEKRTSTREGALRELCSGLRSYALAEQAAANRETAVASVLGLVKRAGPTEGVLCCEALALLLLLLGPEEDEIFAQVVPPLEFLITRSRYEDVRIEVCGGVDGRVESGGLHGVCSLLARGLANDTPHTHTRTRAFQAVQALAMGCFISSSEEEATVRTLRFLYDLFSGSSEGAPATDELKVC